MSTTTVTTTETTVLITLDNAGVQGIPGVNAVVAVTAPITNSGSSGSAVIGINQSALSLTKSQITDFTSGTVASAGTAQQSGTAVYSLTSGTATYATISGTAVSISGSITKSQVSDFTSGTVTSASTAQQSGTAVYATTSGTATYATTSGTAVYATTSGTSVSISGSITKSQVSDFTSGTVANISGTVAQSQVTSLVTDLANRAILNAANTFTAGGRIIASESDTVKPLTLRRASATAVASYLDFQTSTGTSIASVSVLGYGNFPRVSAGSASDLGYAILSVNTGSPIITGAVIRGAASQTSSLQEWQNSGGTALTTIASNGQIVASQGINLTTIRGGDSITAITISNNRGVTVGSNVAIQGGGSAVLGIANASTIPNGTPVNGGVLYVNTGALNYLGTSGVAQQIVAADGSVKHTAPTLGTIGLIIQGAVSQSANLQEWQNSGGTALASVNTAGGFFSPTFTSTNSYSVMGEANGGGSIRFARATGTTAAPTNQVRLQIIAGTTGSKLVAVSPTGVVYTILDNIV